MKYADKRLIISVFAGVHADPDQARQPSAKPDQVQSGGLRVGLQENVRGRFAVEHREQALAAIADRRGDEDRDR